VSEILIRAAEESDAEAFQDIFACQKVIANTLQLPWRSLDWQRQRLRETPPGMHRLVAVLDGRVVGNLGLQQNQSPRRRDVASFGMAVHDAYHNRGVGSALMAAMLELADGWLGVRRIEMEVWTDNKAAIHLYEKFGFVIEGTARQHARRAGELVDAHYMARLRGLD
jgi:L-phenylalanine/L-methionine N-acetyltransferase